MNARENAMSFRCRLAGWVLALLLIVSPAMAAELRIGLAAAPTSLDPHFHNNGVNNAQARHVFESLTAQDANQQLQPGLAESWRLVDDTTWEFALRRNVTFHDGTPFTADDVAFSISRAPNVPNSPSSFGTFTKQIKGTTIVDPHTIRLHTDGPAPLLAIDMSMVAIVSRKHGEGATTSDYQTGRAMIGTGPYRFLEHVPNDRIVYARNPAYWGGVEPWERVTFRIITVGPSRVAALLAGDVDLISDVPTTDMARLKQRPNVRLWSGVSNRMTFLSVDVHNEVPIAGNISDKEGNPLPTNPMRDLRVRQALSLAIDRDIIVERVNEGEAIRANQLVPETFFGYNPAIRPETPDLAAARRLLAEAGYPNGFRLVLHTSNDRIINAVRTVQVIAQMWGRIGIQVQVDAMPHTVYSGRTARNELSHMLHSWGAGTGEALGTFVGIVHTRGGAFGGSNRGRYSNPEVDAAIKRALVTVDEDKRRVILQETMATVVADKAILPLVFWVSTWATTPALTYVPQANQATLAMAVRPAR
jgi:peptide/nickel transport system substrate-binding protein